MLIHLQTARMLQILPTVHKEYYDFSVSGDNVSSTDVLVSVDGQDVIGGTQNDDGSWSFDQ